MGFGPLCCALKPQLYLYRGEQSEDEDGRQHMLERFYHHCYHSFELDSPAPDGYHGGWSGLACQPEHGSPSGHCFVATRYQESVLDVSDTNSSLAQYQGCAALPFCCLTKRAYGH